MGPPSPQERSLVNQEGDLQSMQSALAALQAELGTGQRGPFPSPAPLVAIATVIAVVCSPTPG